MNFLLYTRPFFYVLMAGLLATTGAHAQSNLLATTASQPRTISFEGAPTTDAETINSLVAAVPTNLSLVPAPEEGAVYYDDSRKDLSQSLAWILDINAVAPTYWNLYTESRIRLKMKDYTGAKATAEQSYKLALKSMPASREYVMLSAQVVAQVHALTKH